MDTETGSHRGNHNRWLTTGQGTGSARCGESRTPGAGRRSRETAGGDTGTAPWADLTLGQAARQRAGWPHDRKERALALVCLDAAAAARDLAAGTLACPSCVQGRLARWGHGAERVIRLRDGRRARLRPDRAQCRSCRRTHIMLPAWCAPRRADAAGAAMAGQGHRPIAAALGVPPGTVRGWLRRLRAQAGPLRSHALGELSWLGYYPPGPPREPARSPLGDALNAVAAAVDCAIRQFGFGPQMTWPLIGRLGLARFLGRVPAG